MLRKKKKKKYEECKIPAKPAIKYPTNSAHYIEIQAADDTGIFYLGQKRYSKSFRFDDNNYPLYPEEEQERILSGLAKIYSSYSCDIEISILNLLDPNEEEKNDSVLLKPKGDSYDDVREEINGILERRLRVSSRVITVKMLTMTIEAGNIEAAKSRFTSIEMSLAAAFDRIDSRMTAVGTTDRMMLLWMLQNPGAIHTQFTKLDKAFIKETLALKSFGYVKNDIRLVGSSGEWFVRMYYFKELPDAIEDDFITQLVQLQYPMSFAIHDRPVNKAVAIQMLDDHLMQVQKGINKEQDRNNKAGHYHSQISDDRETEQRVTKEMLSDIRENNEKLSVASFTLTIFGKSIAELDTMEDNIETVCEEKSVELAQHEIKLREAYVTSLPLGLRMVKTLRPMFSSSLSGLNPFSARDIAGSGINYGINHLTKKLLFVDRKRLSSPHGVVVGKSGSGKSLLNKYEKTQVFLTTDDDIIIVDPMSEYRPFAKRFSGSFYDCGRDAGFHINPLGGDASRVTSDFIKRKSLLMTAIMSALMREDFRSVHQHILERSVRKLYEKGTSWNLNELKKMLGNEENSAAEELELAMECLTDGTLSMFSDATDDMEYKRITVFGLSARGQTESEQISIPMMVILDYIIERVQRNYEKGKTTWIDVDEIQRILSIERAADMFADFWQTTRKLRAVCTAMTTTIRNLKDNSAGQSIISSVGYKAVFMLEKSDRVDAKKEFDLSDVHLNYIRICDNGSAVLLFDKTEIQMENEFDDEDKQTSLYRMLSTNPYER